MSRFKKGFTLLELLIVLTITSILLSTALPAFSSLITSTRINSIYKQLFSSLQYARSKAVFTNSTAVLCPTENQEDCTDNWTLPLMVFIDRNSNEQRENNEEIERFFTLPISTEIIEWRASGSTRYIRYFADGSTKSQNGRFTICPEDNDLENAQQIVVSRTGRPRRALQSEVEEKHCH